MRIRIGSGGRGSGCFAGIGGLFSLFISLFSLVVCCGAPLLGSVVNEERISALIGPLVCPAGSNAEIFGIEAVVSNVNRLGSSVGTSIKLQCVDAQSGAVVVPPSSTFALWVVAGFLAATAGLTLLLMLPIALLLTALRAGLQARR